jgi:hypothetical protein
LISANSGLSQSGAAPLYSRGVQTLHGLYPAKSASCAEAKNSTFARFGFRAVQVGRQNIPVVLTPTTNIPSKLLSLLTNAEYNISLSGNE